MFQTTHYVKLLPSGEYTLARRMGRVLLIFGGLDAEGNGIVRCVRYDRKRFKLLRREGGAQ